MKGWKTAILLGLAVFLMTGAIFGLPALFGARDNAILLRSAVKTQAIVTGDFPYQHGSCSYSFTAGARTYTGTGGSCSDRPVGSRMDIWYASEKPSISHNWTPGPYWTFGAFAFLGWALIVMPLFIVVNVLWHKNRRKRVAD